MRLGWTIKGVVDRSLEIAEVSWGGGVSNGEGNIWHWQLAVGMC